VDNLKAFESDDLQALIEKYSPFFKEARKRILFTLSFFAAVTVAGFVFYEKIIKLLIIALGLEGINIVFTSPFQFINLAISCGAVSGLVATFPILIIQILYFLKPALRKKEYKTIARFIPFSIFLFIVGFIFGAVIMRWQIEISMARASSLGIGSILDISSLLSIVFLVSALMGIGFQFPIILLILMRIGLIKHQQLSKKRLWIYLGAFIFTILLPIDSIIADFFLSLPLIFLFELTLILNRIFDRKRS
jgi:sec-independent protein translocase protein TatC